MHDYRICGLTVASELELPGAVYAFPSPVGAQVFIRRDTVPASIDGATASGPTWEMDSDTFLLRVPRLARFLIRSGRDIAVEVEAGAIEQDVTGFVLGSVFGILLHQRGALVLHGSAVARNGRAIAICGHSGAGKSTLAAALCREGFSFVTDDLCVVGLDDDRQPVVLPDGRRLKLWKQSIDNLDLSARREEAVRESFEKYYIQPFDTPDSPPRLSAVYILGEDRPPLKAGIEGLALPDAMRALDYEAYRPGLREKMGQKPEMLAHAAAILGHARIFRFVRPLGFDHMSQVLSDLRSHWDCLDA